MKPIMIRQGDVLLEQVQEIPKDATKAKENILAEGEVHGHVHEVFGGEVLESGEEMFVDISEGNATLEHILRGTRTKADHDLIDLPAGKWKVTIQNQYDPYAKTAKRVMD